MKKLLSKLTIVTIVCLSSTSCNTLQGLGKDFEKMGSVLQKTPTGSTWGAQADPYAYPTQEY